ncbi:viomycin phosphotransferase [Streptomyces sp. NBC_01433]|uniref:viomycin phosphotransferase n=1 Tax=Streptomyces sp. NBC_01433 TaxID=2903864 RepID=UPI002251F86D|nr:viomycin phosphotransferase [Streptomyces sp. NBC_01433]MCX4679235.1 viomycin phosphotransferase [Streptomyces sp. NBC_01433]
MESSPTMGIIETHHDVLSRRLPGDRLDELAVHQGQFHQVVIGSDRVVCFARTEAAAVRLPARAAVLRALAGLDLGFRTPRPLSESGCRATDEPPYLVLSRIPGAPLKDDAFDSPEVAEAVATQYATLLSGLAAAANDEKVRAVLPLAPEGEWQEFGAGVRAELFPLMSDSGRERAERELTALDALPRLTAAVVHGDPGGENVLWETSGGVPRLSGVVDWDEVTVGDPAEDLAAVGASYGEELLGRVLTLGGWAGTEMAGRIAAIRGTFALQQAFSAQRDGDEEELADGLTGYR